MFSMFTRRKAKPVRRAPRLEGLEERLAPAVVTTFVNDNWAIITDVGPGGLSAGDTVRNDNDTVNPGTITGTFGTDAFSSINSAIAQTNTGGTVRVLEGTYTENVTINKNLTLESIGGRNLATITGISNGALGTILVNNNTTGVTIGGTGKGFTINGIDNPSAGIESAAIYFQGSFSNALIQDNKIVANGDEAIISEFGATVSNFTIDNNEIAGKTFTGTTPGGSGFGSQFTTPNVPRQLVVIGGGSGGGNTSNVIFTNNNITGIAGGINSLNEEQGNGLVTIDSVGATITGNTFAGTTNRFGAALRARGTNTTVTGNTFNSTNLGLNTTAITLGATTLPSGTDLADVVAANTFDKGIYLDNGTSIGFNLQGAIGAVPAGTTLNVLPGTYNGNVDVNKAITIKGDFTVNGTFVVSNAGAVIDGQVTALGFTLAQGSTFKVTINSATDFDQSTVTGPVTLNNATLQVALNYTPTPGTKFVIIANDGTDPVNGTFAGLPEGTTLTINGVKLVLTYKGGDGNDVELRVPATTVDRTFVVGGVGAVGGTINIYDGNGQLIRSFTAFAGFQGSVSSTTGDVNGDGVADIIVATATGSSHVKVFDGATGAEIRSFLAFDGYLGGVSIAAGDVNNDGKADLIVGANAGVGPHVKVFSGADGSLLASFFAFDQSFLGGVSVGAGNVDGVPGDEIIVNARGVGHVKAFRLDGTEVSSFLLPQALRTAFFAVGDVNGDGMADLILGSAVGQPSKVTVLDFTTQAEMLSFSPFSPAFLGGVRVEATDTNGDGKDEILAASATAVSHVMLFDEQLTALASFLTGMGSGATV